MTTNHLRVGIAGLGEMGGGMAERLLDAGFPLTGWNRTRAKAEQFAARGMSVAATPRELAAQSDLVISMVTDNAALTAVLEGPDGVLAGLQRGAILAEMSTTSPTSVRELAHRVTQQGAHLLDAPVLGSILTLRQGNLLIMVGGAQAVYARAEPAFQAIGATVRHVGEVGQAKALKLAANLNLAVQVVAMSEGVVLAEKMGLDRRVALETLLGGVIASPALKYRMPFVLEPPDHAWFDVKMIQKDLQLALDLAHELGVPLGTGASAQQTFTSARGFGYTREDFAVVFHAVARGAGIARDPSTVPAYARKEAN